MRFGRYDGAVRFVALPGIAWLLASLACYMAGVAPPTPTPPSPVTVVWLNPTADASATPSSTPDLTPPLTALMPTIPPIDTPAISTLPPVTTPPAAEITATTPGDCGYDASFYYDVSIPDGTEIGAGESFEKVWRLLNDGCLTWPGGTRLMFDSGARMGGPDSVDVPLTEPEALVDVSVTLTAPQEPGTYKGYWQLQAPDGMRFGPRIFVEIVVAAPGEPPAP